MRLEKRKGRKKVRLEIHALNHALNGLKDQTRLNKTKDTQEKRCDDKMRLKERKKRMTRNETR